MKFNFTLIKTRHIFIQLLELFYWKQNTDMDGPNYFNYAPFIIPYIKLEVEYLCTLVFGRKL